MKSRIIMILLLLLVFTVFASAPPKTKAGWWVDELGDCSNLYVNQANYINWLYDNEVIGLSEYNYNMDIYGGYYTQCLSTVNAPTQEPDFCAAALAASQDCIFQAQNLTYVDLGFASECRLKSGIDQCQ